MMPPRFEPRQWRPMGSRRERSPVLPVRLAVAASAAAWLVWCAVAAGPWGCALPPAATADSTMKEFNVRRVIDGKIYDTETAQQICGLPCWFNRTDFEWHDTALYRSPKGRYFVAGEGNAASMWSQPVGNNCRGGGRGLRAVDAAEARAIMEDAGCSVDDFRAAGLEVEEG